MAANVHYLQVKELLLPLIISGSKDLEVRVVSERFTRIRPGDTIVFNGWIKSIVKATRLYPNFDQLLTGVI